MRDISGGFLCVFSPNLINERFDCFVSCGLGFDPAVVFSALMEKMAALIQVVLECLITNEWSDDGL